MVALKNQRINSTFKITRWILRNQP